MRPARDLTAAIQQWKTDHDMTRDQWLLAQATERVGRMTVHQRPPGRLAEIGEPWTWPQLFVTPARVHRALDSDRHWTIVGDIDFVPADGDHPAGTFWFVAWSRNGFDEHPLAAAPLQEHARSIRPVAVRIRVDIT